MQVSTDCKLGNNNGAAVEASYACCVTYKMKLKLLLEQSDRQCATSIQCSNVTGTAKALSTYSHVMQHA